MAVCGTSAKDVPEYGWFGNGNMLDIFTDGKVIYITEFDRAIELGDLVFKFSNGTQTGATYGTEFHISDGLYYPGEKIYSLSSYSWIVHNGNFVVPNDVIGAQVSAGACPKEVPDVSPWIKHTDVPDEWRIVKPNETPDPDNDDGDALPVVIPIHPAKPDKPSETETEESTEKPDKDKSKDQV